MYAPVIEVLQAYYGNPPSSLRIRRLARILEQCEDLDSSCELDSSVSAEPELNGLDGLVSELAGYFGEIAPAKCQIEPLLGDFVNCTRICAQDVLNRIITRLRVGVPVQIRSPGRSVANVEM